MSTGALHVILQWVLTGAIALHVAGALKHHVIDRDATLRRMLPGHRTALPTGAAAGPCAARACRAGRLGRGTWRSAPGPAG